MTIAVYHYTRRLNDDQIYQAMTGFNSQEHAVKVALFLSCGAYDCVALLPGEDLDSAYEQTQNLYEGGWTTSLPEGGKAFVPTCRSSSVGDVLAVIREGETALYVTSSFGFTEITEQVVANLETLGHTLASITNIPDVQELLQ